MIFPSGGNVTWKTGFHALAKELGADIIVLGLDYVNMRVVVDSFLSNDLTFDETRREAITRLRKYSGGPFRLILRVLIGYGCMTYDVSWKKLLFLRLITAIPILFAIYILLKKKKKRFEKKREKKKKDSKKNVKKRKNVKIYSVIFHVQNIILQNI